MAKPRCREGRRITARIYPSTKVRDVRGGSGRVSKWSPKDIKRLSREFNSPSFPKPLYFRDAHGRSSDDVLGYVTDIRYNKLDKWMWGDMVVDDDDAVTAIKRGGSRGISFCYGLGAHHKRAIEISLLKSGEQDFDGAEIIEQHSKDGASTSLISWPLENGPLPQMNSDDTQSASQLAGGASYDDLGLIHGRDGTYFSLDPEMVSVAKTRAISLGLDPSRITQKTPEDMTPDLIAQFENGTEEQKQALISALLIGATEGEEATRNYQALQKKIAKEKVAQEKAEAEKKRASLLPLAKQLTETYAQKGYSDEDLQTITSQMVDNLSSEGGELWANIIKKQLREQKKLAAELEEAQRRVKAKTNKRQREKAISKAGLFENAEEPEQVMAHSRSGVNNLLSAFFLGGTPNTLGKRERQRADAEESDDDAEVVVKHARFSKKNATCRFATESGFSIYPAIAAAGIPGMCATDQEVSLSGTERELIIAHSKSAELNSAKLTRKDGSHLDDKDVRGAIVAQCAVDAIAYLKRTSPGDVENSMATINPTFFNQLIHECYIKPDHVPTNQSEGIYGSKYLRSHTELQTADAPVWTTLRAPGATVDMSRYIVPAKDFVTRATAIH